MEAATDTPNPSAETSADGDTEATRSSIEVVRSYFAALGKRDLEAMLSHWHPDGIETLHGMAELRIPDEYAGWFSNLFRAFPDFEIRVIDAVADSRKVAVRWEGFGVFDGDAPFEGINPNGSKVSIQGFDLLEVRDGQIVSNNAYLNGADLARQLGALPSSGSLADKAFTTGLNLKNTAGRYIPGL